MPERCDTPSLVETMRAACLEAALAAYEDAGIRGLCAEGRWEAALAAIRLVELSGVLEPPADLPTSTTVHPIKFLCTEGQHPGHGTEKGR
jgi:hypothetical protein